MEVTKVTAMLDLIVESTRRRVKAIDTSVPVEERQIQSLEKSIKNKKQNGMNPVIAEIKFRSPSEGIIRRYEDPAGIASGYVDAGCAGISVLTNPEFFGGDNSFIEKIRPQTAVPVLRKDFVVDEAQVRETAALGADAVLLIAAVLGDSLGEFIEYTHGFGLEALVEVHDEAEMENAISGGARIIGINNRNLKTMKTELETTRRLGPLAAGRGVTVVCESGITGPADIREMREYCDGFLVGTYLMKAENPAKALEGLVCA
ncbi:indole-3-glycerol phosphate synthase TrpC [Methanolacinia paynteri]|uniref:indole-3-glycerol phosphate synthase TrpC n=1 Tax=Methanolacinia paynteri TaxID=230356 RepID=UPI000A3F9897|nr:indole-3-glycerol-phosphate synthase [Methanolacinia paynteri]